jgi:hypothetical protein
VTPEEALESATLSDNKRRWSVQGEGAVQLPEQTPWCPDIFSMDGLKVAKEKYGFHGSTPHLLTYNATKMRPLMMPFIPMHRDLTVCHSSKSWFIYLGYIGYSLFIMVILGTQAYSETEYGEESACKNPAKNTDFCQLEPVLSRAVSDFRFLISFILAGFVAANVNKWIQRRSNYASLCGTARNLGITAAAVLTSSDNDTASAAAFKAEKRRIGRYIILAFELSVLKARGHMDTDHGRQYLEDIELLLPGEWERMAPGDRHSSVFYWILSISKQLCDDMSRSIGDDTGSSTQSNLQIIAACVGSMRAQVWVVGCWSLAFHRDRNFWTFAQYSLSLSPSLSPSFFLSDLALSKSVSTHP